MSNYFKGYQQDIRGNKGGSVIGSKKNTAAVVAAAANHQPWIPNLSLNKSKRNDYAGSKSPSKIFITNTAIAATPLMKSLQSSVSTSLKNISSEAAVAIKNGNQYT